MHYYSFNPKDYMSKTAFLEPMEDLAYRRMLDHCYLTELPLPEDVGEKVFTQVKLTQKLITRIAKWLEKGVAA